MNHHLRSRDPEFVNAGPGSSCAWPTGSYCGSLVDRTYPVIPSYVDHGGQSVVRFQVDTCGFSPEDINIKTTGGQLIISAKHEERSPVSGTSSWNNKPMKRKCFQDHQLLREYVRMVDIPEGARADAMKSRLTSSGILSIEAPYIAPANKRTTDRELPIEHDRAKSMDTSCSFPIRRSRSKPRRRSRSRSDRSSCPPRRSTRSRRSRSKSEEPKRKRSKPRRKSEEPSKPRQKVAEGSGKPFFVCEQPHDKSKNKSGDDAPRRSNRIKKQKSDGEAKKPRKPRAPRKTKNGDGLREIDEMSLRAKDGKVVGSATVKRPRRAKKSGECGTKTPRRTKRANAGKRRGKGPDSDLMASGSRRNPKMETEILTCTVRRVSPAAGRRGRCKFRIISAPVPSNDVL